MNAAYHLTKAQLRELEAELRSERARLDRSLAIRVETDDVPRSNGGFLGGDAQAEGKLAVALETRIFDRHETLDAALRRFETGTYGVCMSCRNPIPYGRLLAMPETTYCLSCGAIA
jgi:RNA polymerase-binding transcription factor DksA